MARLMVLQMEKQVSLSLHPKQGAAFLSRATEILYGGAAGGGKSHLLRVAALAWCYDIPGLQVYLFRRTFPDLCKNHIEGPSGFLALLGPWIECGFARFIYSKNVIEFINGSRINLCHCQYPKDVQSFLGAEIHALLIDEVTQWTEDVYKFLRSRVRAVGIDFPDRYKGLFPRILLGANPGGVGHNWVRSTFVDFVGPMAYRRADKNDGGMLRQRIPALLEDNPSLMEQDSDYESRLHGLGNPALVKAMRWGDWDIVAGGMFDDLWRADVHVIEPFAIPSSWRVDRSFDWGAAKPFSVGWWARSDGTQLDDGRVYPPGTLFRVAEWYGVEKTNGRIEANKGLRLLPQDIARGILEREARLGLRVIPGPADPSIFDASAGASIATEMKKANVVWKRGTATPGSRVTRWQLLRKRLAASLEVHMEEPGIFFFNHCRDGAIRTVPTAVRDERKMDDVDTTIEDHALDEIGYRLMDEKSSAQKMRVIGV